MRRGVHGSIVSVVAAGFAWVAVGCPTLDRYVCSSAGDCDAGADGVCEDGRCSYDDQTCPSGRRWAGARDLDGPCVPDDTTASTSTGAATTTTPATTTSATGTQTAGEPVCGNGIVEDGEACDELDAVDGDGCNVDCVISGTELWSRSWDFEGGKDYGNGLAIADDGRFAVVGFVTRSTGEQDALVQLRESDGAIVWTDIFGASGLDFGEQIFVDGRGGLVACGAVADPVSGLPQGFLRGYTIEGELLWDLVLDDAAGSWLKDCESRGDGTFAVAGTSGTLLTGNGLVAIYDEDRNEVWTRTYAGTGVELRGVTRHPDGGVVAVGLTHEPRLAIAIGYTADGELVWEPELGLVDGGVDECFGAAHDDSGVYAMGRMLFDGQPGQAWVGRYTDWELNPTIWWPATQNAYGDEFHRLVVHPDGDQVFAGSRAGHDIWIARYDASYQLRWEHGVAGDAGENDKAWDVGFAPDGTLLAVGYETRIGEDANMWLARYAP
jgi:cysteine-rich repeat protein